MSTPIERGFGHHHFHAQTGRISYSLFHLVPTPRLTYSQPEVTFKTTEHLFSLNKVYVKPKTFQTNYKKIYILNIPCHLLYHQISDNQLLSVSTINVKKCEAARKRQRYHNNLPFVQLHRQHTPH